MSIKGLGGCSRDVSPANGQPHIPQPAAPVTRVWDLLTSGHVCWWDATTYGPQGDEEFMPRAHCAKAVGQAGMG